MDAVDTNVLVRLAVGDDPGQTAAAEAFVRRGVWVSHLVIAETVWVLRSVYGLDAVSVADAVAMFLDHPQLAIQDRDVVVAALSQFRARPAIRFSDCLVLEIARKAGHLPVGTFDRDFSKLSDVTRIL
jgi:predicted nucleic-acid-binding protein